MEKKKKDLVRVEEGIHSAGGENTTSIVDSSAGARWTVWGWEIFLAA